MEIGAIIMVAILAYGLTKDLYYEFKESHRKKRITG